MTDHQEDVSLLTIRTRRDPAFPGEVFMRVRAYRIPGDDAPALTAETMSIDDVLAVVERWLREPNGVRPVTLR